MGSDRVESPIRSEKVEPGCYVGSTRRTERIYLELLQSVCKDRHRPLSYDQTRRAIAGLATCVSTMSG